MAQVRVARPEVVARTEFERRLRAYHDGPTALVMVDLLSMIADEALVARFEDRLLGAVREVDGIARLRPGQWAFAVPLEDADQVAARLRDELAAPLATSDGRLRKLSCTVSVTVGSGDELLWQAALQSQAEAQHRLHTLLARILGEARTVHELAELVVHGAVSHFRAFGAELDIDGEVWRAGATDEPVTLEVEIRADGRAGVLRIWARASYREEHGFVSAMRTALNTQLLRVGQLQRALEEADHDPLTGLLNRRGLLARLSAGAVVQVAVIDLDHFKQVNDGHGHDVGDNVLAAVAARLSAIFGRAGLVARWGGEEFVVVADTDVDLEELCELARRSIEVARLGSVAVTVSIGISEGLFDVARSAADRCLFDAKGAGRNRLVCDRS